MALAAGVHPKVVCSRLGHSTVSLTLDAYSHAVPALEEEAAEGIAALVFGAARETSVSKLLASGLATEASRRAPT